MSYSECCREKLSPYKIEGQAKPFIDRDLQLQLPRWDSQKQSHELFAYSSIHSHYAGSSPSAYYLPSQINESELYRAMADAERSYESWKKLEQQLKEAIQS